MRLSTKRILSIGFALIFLIAGLMVFFSLASPEFEKVALLRGEVTAKETLFATQTSVVKQVQKLIEDFKNVAQLRETVSRAVPQGVDTIGAMRQIDAIGRANNVMVVSLAFNATTPLPQQSRTRGVVVKKSLVKPVGTLEVFMTTQGSYKDLREFLRMLETSVRVANIRDFNFSPPEPRSEEQGSMNITVQMYYQAL